jgi:hypothetical protein
VGVCVTAVQSARIVCNIFERTWVTGSGCMWPCVVDTKNVRTLRITINSYVQERSPVTCILCEWRDYLTLTTRKPVKRFSVSWQLITICLFIASCMVVAFANSCFTLNKYAYMTLLSAPTADRGWGIHYFTFFITGPNWLLARCGQVKNLCTH